MKSLFALGSHTLEKYKPHFITPEDENKNSTGTAWLRTQAFSSRLIFFRARNELQRPPARNGWRVSTSHWDLFALDSITVIKVVTATAESEAVIFVLFSSTSVYTD